MQLRIHSDGEPKKTRVLLVQDSGAVLDISTMVVGVEWRCHCDDGKATAKVEFDWAAVQVHGELVDMLFAGLPEPPQGEQLLTGK